MNNTFCSHDFLVLVYSAVTILIC